MPRCGGLEKLLGCVRDPNCVKVVQKRAVSLSLSYARKKWVPWNESFFWQQNPICSHADMIFASTNRHRSALKQLQATQEVRLKQLWH